MSDWSLLNGELKSNSTIGIQIDNRAFSYGDGLFETMRYFDGKVFLLDFHYDRLIRGLKYLEMDIPNSINTKGKFLACCKKLAIESELINARIKCVMYRDAGGFYTPDKNSSTVLFSIQEYEKEPFALNRSGVQLGVFEGLQKTKSELNSLKSTNALFYVKAGLEKKRKGFDELVILNSHDEIVECISSNIFFFVNGEILTPQIESGCLPGTMRAYIFQFCKENNIAIREESLKLDVFQRCDEVFLTNAVKGIQWVSGFGSKRYYSKLTRQFRTLLLQELLT